MKTTFPIRSKSSLLQVAENLSLRCDAKQSEPRFLDLERFFREQETVFLNAYLPEPFVKGVQPNYLDEPGEDGSAYVVNTLSVQNLKISAPACRWILLQNYKSLTEGRMLKDGDVVLTVDGGTSIGKSAVFSSGDFKAQLGLDEDDSLFVTVDSHVAILRPEGVSPEALVYLLSSPIGQAQFQKAESGASGQTAVSESDIRAFKFPKLTPEKISVAVMQLKESLEQVALLEKEAEATRINGWKSFEDLLSSNKKW